MYLIIRFYQLQKFLLFCFTFIYIYHLNAQVPKVYMQNIKVNWFDHNTKFWYKCETSNNEYHFVEVDAITGKKRPAFDHEKVAQLIGDSVSSHQLPFQELSYPNKTNNIHLISHIGISWQYNKQEQTLTPLSIDQKLESISYTLKPEPTITKSYHHGGLNSVTFVNKL